MNYRVSMRNVKNAGLEKTLTYELGIDPEDNENLLDDPDADLIIVIIDSGNVGVYYLNNEPACKPCSAGGFLSRANGTPWGQLAVKHGRECN